MENEEQARKELQNILNGREYQVYYEDSRNIFEIWWDNAKNWLADQLANLFPALEPTSKMAGNILFGIIVLVIVLLAIIFIIIVSRQRKHISFRHQKPFQSENELDWPYQQHVREAHKQEKLEDYSLATRHMFLAILLYFHEKEWLIARMWKTNGEYYEELRKENKNEADLFYRFALLFDRITYGEQQVEKDEYFPFRNEALKWFDENQYQDEQKNA